MHTEIHLSVLNTYIHLFINSFHLVTMYYLQQYKERKKERKKDIYSVTNFT